MEENRMTVKELLNQKGRIAVVEIRVNGKGNQLLFSDSSECFEKEGYKADTCNNIPIQDIMNLNVSNYRTPPGCNSMIIETD